MAGGADPQQAQAALDARKAQRVSDFEFSAEHNLGGELMASERLTRLKAIGERTWQRHFDDRLGLTDAELKRYQDPPEALLANEHVIHSLVMLEQLPLPKNLRRVPEYAGTHHETLVGSGYPRKLGEAELSVPMRIMVIADVFEALTASDRPYEKAQTLSDSVKILSFFKEGKHIDAELFDLFLTSGVYLRYAERYLKPKQIDQVDVANYLG